MLTAILLTLVLSNFVTFELFFVLEGGDRRSGDLGFFCQSNWAALEGCSSTGFLGMSGSVKQMQPELWPFV